MAELLPLSQVSFLAQSLSRREMLSLSLKLLGGAMSASVLEALAAGGPTQTAPTRDVFPGDSRAIMAELAEMIIPRTDTPGALDAGVPAFVEGIVADWYSEQERRIFIDGLLTIDAWCTEHHGKPFLKCTADEREQALAAAAKKQGGLFVDLKKPDAPFFTKLKELTTVGYCTSELVSTQVFRYLPVPGHYDGHYPAEKVGTNWTY